MLHHGRVRNGLIVLDHPGSLPEGAEVTVRLAEPARAEIARMDVLGAEAGIPDLAANIDYYLHGQPKVMLAPYEVAAGSSGLIEPERGALNRAWLALEGLSIGDAFGEQFFVHPDEVEPLIQARTLPAPPWEWTDDTLMALSIQESLRLHGRVAPDQLALSFAHRYEGFRGYGAAMHRLLHLIREGTPWAEASPAQFSGQGSYGNGSAMRVAPLGAYFADDLDRVGAEATRSSVVTHSHPEAVAGAVATAIAAAYAWRLRGQTPTVRAFLGLILPHVPDSIVHERISHAIALDPDCSIRLGVAALGNGDELSAQDTVPFALWCAGRHLADFEEAMWWTVAGLGDRDTTCAIVGGIVALHVGEAGIPRWWRALREPLPVWPFGATLDPNPSHPGATR